MKLNKTLKRILIFISVLLVSAGVYVYYGLKMMDIEDRYGDLQDVYWNSKNDDIVINLKNSGFAFILKEENRIFVFKDNKKIILEDWLNPKSTDYIIYDFEIYRPKNKRGIKNMSESQILTIIKSKDTKLIEKIAVNHY